MKILRFVLYCDIVPTPTWPAELIVALLFINLSLIVKYHKII